MPLRQVSSAEFTLDEKGLDIRLDLPKAGSFSCPKCALSGAKAYDTIKKSHLNFFGHEAYLTARVARVACEKCGIHLAEMPWARPSSGFTLLLEAVIIVVGQSHVGKNDCWLCQRARYPVMAHLAPVGNIVSAALLLQIFARNIFHDDIVSYIART